MFTLSCATIMHAWFYEPARLPPTYNAWISRAAQLDPRILEALRSCRRGEWVYGKDTGLGSLMGSVAQDEGLPFEYGDPATTIPVRCEIVNSSVGLGDQTQDAQNLAAWRRGVMRRVWGPLGCERAALLRFARGWYFAAFMYFPLQSIVLARRLYTLRAQGLGNRSRVLAELRHTVAAASRSAAFLGTFISLVYYGVCLGRNRIGPKLVASLMQVRGLNILFGDAQNGKNMDPQERHRAVAQILDSGLAVNLGCWLCGLSLLVEEQRRRTEMMLFVAPRAVGAWVPRRYHRMVSVELPTTEQTTPTGADGRMQHLWKEHVVFALSTALVITVVQERPDRVRGVLGALLGEVFR